MSDEIQIVGGPEPQIPSLAVVTRDRIRKLIEEYLQTEDLQAAARELNVLPLTEATDGRWYGVRPDGDLLSFNQHSPYQEMVEEDLWKRASTLLRASDTYPELEPLVPPPPLSCQTCARCRGAGFIVRVEGEVMCICEGLGWLPAIFDEVEKREPKDSRQETPN